MQHLPTLDLLRRTVRSVVCTHCIKRPPGSESFSPAVERRCEPECTIFANIGKLAKIAYDASADPRAPIERQMREMICLNCHAHPQAGPDCIRRLERECPLSVYLLDVIEPMERVLNSRAAIPHVKAHVVGQPAHA